MDFVLATADQYLLDSVWAKAFPGDATDAAGKLMSRLPRNDMLRQSVSLYCITLVGIALLYFAFAGVSYYFIFDHRMMKHPRFLKNQVKMEIRSSLVAFPVMDVLTLPWFLMEVQGHSRLYESVSDIKGISLAAVTNVLAPILPSSLVARFAAQDCHIGGGWTYMVFSACFFLWFTDLAIYFVHRWEHHPAIYKHIHKPHHKWIIPTPFASHAFHPLDGYAQSLPYHIFVFLFPLHKFLYLGLFVVVNMWSILIHDSEMIVDHPLEHVINGPSHHTLHHIYFTCNYGQYFTWADKMGGSYRHPVKGEDPLIAVLSSQHKKALSAAGSTPVSTATVSPSSCASSSDGSDSDDAGYLSAPRGDGLRSRGMRRLASSAATSVDGEDEK